jgi:hypothetical protein
VHVTSVKTALAPTSSSDRQVGRRTRLQILARDFRHPKSGNERTVDSDESAAAIGGNHRHEVDVVPKKLCGRSEYGVRPLHATRGFLHEIADRRVKRQTSTQRTEKLPATAVASQDFAFRDWKGVNILNVPMFGGLRLGRRDRPESFGRFR